MSRTEQDITTAWTPRARYSAVSVNLRDLKRARTIRGAVGRSLRRPHPVAATALLGSDEERYELLRRRNLHADAEEFYAGPPMMKEVVFRAGNLRTAARLLRYAWAVLRWYALRFGDKLLRRDTVERRAARLRRIIERTGGTAVKVGQQLAMRIDLMPYAYGVELSKLHDRMPVSPRDYEYAVRRVERQTGRPLAETFASFTREPIGSASVACVFEAVLHTGERVAVKVRRPGIGETFVADCRALALLFALMEFLTLIRPGLANNFVFEFRNMLVEELDFVKEARHTELFRRRAHKHLRRVTAPRVHFELSGEDVLVTEFVEGVWVADMIAAVERGDEVALRALAEMDICPKKVARKLIRANQYGIFENLLFHADPHPSNVLVRPGNTLVFIDFGAVGAYTTRERHNWRQLAYYQRREDVGRMVQSALAILEPLPPIDIDEFSKRLEAVFWQDLYAFRSKHSQWYERTSARVWISFLGLAREYNIPMNLNTLRMIRSTLLYETVAARLHSRINAYREHHKYNKEAGKRARKRVRRAVHKRLFEGPSQVDYLRFEQWLQMGDRFMYLFQRHLDTPPYRFSLLISKAVYAVNMAIRAAVIFVSTSVAVGLGVILYEIHYLGLYGWADVALFRKILEVLGGPSLWVRIYWFIILAVCAIQVRRVLFRFWDKEIRRDNTSGLN
jgi:ubiquinone biosynthesis protein